MKEIEAADGKVSSFLDWDEALRLYEKHIATGSESLIISDTVKLAHSTKVAPEEVFVRAVPVLVELLGFNRSSIAAGPSVPEAAGYCLIRFMRRTDGSLVTTMVDSGAVFQIVRLLGNSDGYFRKILVKVLWYVIEFETKSRELFARHGGVRTVVDLLHSHLDGCRRYLLEILSMLALVREVRRTLIVIGGLQYLVEAAKCSSMISRERACQAIGLLGINTSIRHMLVELGVIPALIELLRDGGDSAKFIAGNALGVISAHVDHIRPVAEAGAVPLYAELLRGPDAIGREIAEDVFCVLAVAEEIAIDIADHLVRILQEDNDEAKAAAAGVFWDLAGYKHISVVRTSGAIPIMVDLMRDGSTGVKGKVSGAFAQLSYNEADREALTDAGAVPVLMDALLNENEEVRDNAAEALISFAEDRKYQDMVSDVIDVPAFISMKNRIAQTRTSEEHIARSFRRLGARP